MNELQEWKTSLGIKTEKANKLGLRPLLMNILMLEDDATKSTKF